MAADAPRQPPKGLVLEEGSLSQDDHHPILGVSTFLFQTPPARLLSELPFPPSSHFHFSYFT